MAPTNGSDSERLMAEIEAFLRTGEAPPAAPEPPPSALPPTRAFRPGSLDPGSGGSTSPRRRPDGSRRARVSRRLAELPVVRGLVVRVRFRIRAGRVGAGRHPAAAGLRPRGSGGRAPGRLWSQGRFNPRPGSATPGVPRWTPARAVGVVAVLLGLVLLPVVWANRAGHVNLDGPDHASIAPPGPGYNFLQVNRSGTPVRWNPCLPIYYQLDLSAAPAWATSDLARALTAISVASGIRFVYEGPTNQFPGTEIPPGAGPTQSPVVIAWATPDQSQKAHLPTDLASANSSVFPVGADALARAEPVVSADQLTGHGVYVTGTVVISAAASELKSGFGPGSDGVLLLHQLGRLVGLADVTDPASAGEVMNPKVLSTGVTGLGSGDVAGLRRLGSSSGCLDVPANGTLEPAV